MNFRKIVLFFSFVFAIFNASLFAEEQASATTPNKQKILIVGGAGYIGSHTAYIMAQQGYDVIVLDNLWYGQTFNFPWATLVKGDYGDGALLETIFSKNHIDAVMHFAAFIEVGESVNAPAKYYDNNVVKTINLLNAMIKHNVKKIIFSSSAAVYGKPQETTAIVETQPRSPINPYGNTKFMDEMLLEDYCKAHGLAFVALRYFNVAGAYPEKNLGDWHEPSSHVIPILLRAARLGEPFTIFGTDYQTPDGTCIRDYIHVRDVAQAHSNALDYLNAGNRSDCFNLGTSHGFSVKQLVEVVEKVTGKKIAVQIGNRRAGDPDRLVANADKAKEVLKWEPKYSDLESMVTSAYQFELFKHKNVAVDAGKEMETSQKQ